MFDVLVTLLAALFSLPDLAQEHVRPTPSAVLVQVALTLPLVMRRVWPSAVFAVIFGVSAVAGLLNVHLVVSFSLVVALYTVTAYEPRRRALAAAGLLEGGVIAAGIRLAGSAWWHLAILGTGMVAAALGLGLYAATRRAYLKELHDRAERLERERDQQQELAAAAERARITREMHDILAHHLAVMIALSDGAAAAATGSSPQVAKAMQRGLLARFGFQIQNARERFKHHILHQLVFATVGSRAMSHVPVIAETVPPHMRRGIERIDGEKALVQVKHRTHAVFPDGKW